jgi:hypothetical protein
MFVKTKTASICGIGNLWQSHNLTSLTNKGSYEFPPDCRSIVCGSKTKKMVKRIQDWCSVKKVDYLCSFVGSDAQGTQSEL